MLVVDSSAWIEIATRSPLEKELRRHLPHQSQCIVPTIVQFEMAKWLTREVTRDRRNRFLAYLGRCQVINLSSRIALRAAYLSAEHKLSVADAIIYTTAVLHEAKLLTCDAHFKGLPQVIYLPKIAA